MDAEKAHRLALLSLKLTPDWMFPDAGNDEGLETFIWERKFSNPIGLAAGFDKNAEIISASYNMGFGFVEVGGVTLRPQDGNPKPRLFRLPEDQAVINRMGLNSQGADKVALSLEKSLSKGTSGPIAVNLSLNKAYNNYLSDFKELAKRFEGLVDLMIVNVSSPNTPGLRDLQDTSILASIVNEIRETFSVIPGKMIPKVLVKISPDLSPVDIERICFRALTEPFDGLVISNTSTDRPEILKSSSKKEIGGLSGKPLYAASTEILRQAYIQTGGEIPLIGVGGVFSGQDSYNKIKAGASLVQLYSSLVFEGPSLVARIKTELRDLMRQDGYLSISEAVGSDHV